MPEPAHHPSHPRRQFRSNPPPSSSSAPPPPKRTHTHTQPSLQFTTPTKAVRGSSSDTPGSLTRRASMERNMLNDEAVWMDDDASDVCMICRSKFTLLHRRHHCRYCGACILQHRGILTTAPTGRLHLCALLHHCATALMLCHSSTALALHLRITAAPHKRCIFHR